MTWTPAEPVLPWLYAPLPADHPAAQFALALAEPESGGTLTAIADPASDDPLICYCFGVTRNTLRRIALQQEIHDTASLTQAARAGGGCGSCQPDLQDLLQELWQEVADRGYVVLCHEHGITPGGESADSPDAALAESFEALPALAQVAKITEILNKEVRPWLQGDGGDLTLVDVEGHRVLVSLVGACGTCPASLLTLRGLVEERLRQYVSPRLEVIAV